ncbi:MAG: M1 family aminopeptidase [Gemmatimonadaceae bacterium]
MFGSLLRFELISHLRRPTTWLYFAILFLLAFGVVSSDIITTADALGKVKRNSPFALAQNYVILVAIGQVITSALVGTSVLRDFDVRVHELLFTTRLTRNGYLAAKFLAAFAAMVVVYCALPIGALVGSMMPWIDRESLQPIQIWFYVQPFLVFALPVVFFVSAVFFAVGALTRNQFMIYTVGILLVVGISIGGELTRTLDKDQVANLVEPFGINTLRLMTRYWTVVEKNTQTVPFSGFLLTNRLVWFAIALMLIAITFAFVRLEKDTRKMRKAKAEKTVKETTPVFAMPVLHRQFTGKAALTTWWSVTWFHARSLLRSVPFLAISVIGIINVVMGCIYADQLYNTHVWPVTWVMTEAAVGGSGLFIVILLTFYSGELVWRERQVEIAQVLDASPVRNASVLLGKISALLIMIAVFDLCAIAAGISVQLAKGYTHIDLSLYLVHFFVVDFPAYFIFIALAFFIQSIVPKKPIGHVLMILIYVLSLVYQNIGWEHRLYQIGSGVQFRYSDLNRYGPYPKQWLPFHGYWTMISVMIVVLAYLFWARGTETKAKLQTAGKRFGAWAKGIFAGSLVGAGMLGSFIFYNTNVLNTYEPQNQAFKRVAQFERTYKPFEKVNQPKVIGVSMAVNIWPKELRFTTSGRLTMINRHSVAIDTLFVEGIGSKNSRVVWDSLAIDRPATMIIADTVHGVFIYRLATPLAPNDTLHLNYHQTFIERGFSNNDQSHAVADNGTFINRDAFPHIAYDPTEEIQSDEERRKQKLPARERIPAITDTARWNDQFFSPASDFITFDAVVSTDTDQIAMAPGYLKREWREGNRRYFSYAMDAPIPDFYSFLSARYTVTRDKWNDIPIEIYHHSTHTFDVPRMIEASKAALAYYTAQFGPYQHKQLRILEFPRYSTFAQSFPNTIPYSEGIGFIARVDSTSETDIDYPYFVTAHEIAHQWFPYQRMPANVQGAQVLSEALAEYSALAVLDEKYGDAHLQKFLRFELDQYLRGRSSERKKEMPLMLVENQGYIQYQKGSLAFFALRDLIGTKALNGALRAYLDAGRFAGPPYATTYDLLKELKKATPDSMQYAIHDLFETITLWDLRTDSATTTKLPDGTWKVRLAVSSSKLRADSLGNEKKIPIADYVDVGVFGEKTPGNRVGKPLEVRKVKITTDNSLFEFIVKEKPLRAGIDPFNKLIDRNPGDNSKDVVNN